MQEIEAKFYISNLKALQGKLQSLGGVLLEPRVLEINLRFDTPANVLQQNHRVLRLRKDHSFHLTYKDDGGLQDGAMVRREIEFDVSDYTSARQFLEALGYEVVVIYEKYRTTYGYQNSEVLLDELPYGNFCEIEGPDVDTIQQIAEDLEITWQNSIPLSYLALLEYLRNSKKTHAENLTFQAFAGIEIQAEDLGVIPADLPTA